MCAYVLSCAYIMHLQARSYYVHMRAHTHTLSRTLRKCTYAKKLVPIKTTPGCNLDFDEFPMF